VTATVFALIGVGVLLCVVGWLFYRRVRERIRRRATPLIAIRILSLSVLALLLVRPGFGCHRSTAKPSLTVLVDASSSMALTDTPQRKSRFDAALSLAHRAKERLSDAFTINIRQFATETTPMPQKPRPVGGATNIIKAVLDAADDTDAVLLLTDGNDTSVLAERPLGRIKAPVFAVGIGSRDPAATPDIAIRLAPLPSRLFTGSTLKVTCWVTAYGFEGETLPVTLSINGKVREKKGVTVRKGRAKVPFQVRLNEAGLFEVTASVEPQKGELTKKNNRDAAFVQVVESKIRIFYAEGSLRWEYKFLRQILVADPNVEFVGAIHIGGGQFSLQGAKEAITLEGPLPTADELRKFDVVILGDLTRQMLPDRQLAKLEKFVTDGGTLIVVAGKHILSGDFAATPLELLLPVRVGTVRKVVGRYTPRLTEEGKEHPVFEGLGKYLRGEDAATLETLYVAGGAKAAAVVLAEHPFVRAGTTAAPLLLFIRYGAGRVAAVMSDTFWQWFFRFRSLGRNSPYVRFFGQFLRWAAKAQEQTAGPLSLTLQPPIARCGQPVRITVIPNAVEAESVRLFCDNQPLPLRRHGQTFTTTITRFAPKHYKIRAEGATRNGQPVKTQKTLIVGTPNAEWRKILLNENLLARIAERSRGRFVLPPQFETVLAELNALAEAQTGAFQPVWHSPWLMLALFGLLFSEWWLRKRRGLI